MSQITIRDVHEVYGARILVESQTARLACGRIDRDALATLNAAVKTGYEPADRTSEARFLEANRAFHLTIADATGNERLVAIVSGLLTDCDRILNLAMRHEHSEQRFRHGHERIIEALHSGNADTAERETAQAISKARDLALSVLLNSDGVVNAGLRLPANVAGRG